MSFFKNGDQFDAANAATVQAAVLDVLRAEPGKRFDVRTMARTLGASRGFRREQRRREQRVRHAMKAVVARGNGLVQEAPSLASSFQIEYVTPELDARRRREEEADAQFRDTLYVLKYGVREDDDPEIRRSPWDLGDLPRDTQYEMLRLYLAQKNKEA